ncbi:MAG: metal ABC transporter permease [Thermomicrobiales bacterium]|nr:metal ABC transporter permease [Thermomicrobiales bacterium]
MNWLTQPWEHPFMQNAFLAAMLVGLICGVIGVFVVLKGLAFMGDALSHAIFPGIVIAYLWGANYLIGALVAAIIVSFLIGLASSHTRIKNDTAIGVFFAGAFALGIALISTQRTYTRDLTSFLIGSILGVSRNDLYLTAAVGGIVLLVVALTRRELTSIAFDPVFSRADGIDVRFYEQLFFVMLSLAIVVSLQTVGNILVLALLVTPAATARLLTDRLVPMIGISAVLGTASGLIGLYFSYHWALASGASVVLVATAFFLAAYLFAPQTGTVTNYIRKRMHYPHPERDAFPVP